MKKLFRYLSIVLIACYIVTTNNIIESKAADSKRKIIVFKKSVQANAVKDKLLKKHNVSKVKDLSLINGMSVELTEKQEKALLKENDILRIENDIEVKALGKNSSSSKEKKSSQIVPWGISSIKADMVPYSTTNSDVKVAIIDSGVDITHPDLSASIKGGYNAINQEMPYTDDYGHGTHVAGIIAATNNSIGVVGVSPNVSLYSVKVLDSTGSGYISDVIEGIEWSITNNINIINLSLESADSESLHDAIIKAYESNIVTVAASGNNSNSSVSYPAAYNEVISVSAIDSNNKIASFSSTGKVDVCAPGVNIYSTYKDSTYVTMSGTSMAAPHVTGTVALILSLSTKSDSNGDGRISPDEVKEKLQNTCTDLGTPGTDSIYGTGLVNAYYAVTN